MKYDAFSVLLSGVRVATREGAPAAHYVRRVVLDALTTRDLESMLRGHAVDVTEHVEAHYVNVSGSSFVAVLS